MKYFSFIFIVFSSNLFAQTNHKSILYLKAESKQLIENTQSFPDSIITNNILNKKHSGGNIAAQAISGSLLGLGTGFITSAITFGIVYRSNDNTFSAAAFYIMVPSSLIIGEALGVHLIARQENPNHSFWQTVKYSSYGAGGGVLLSLIIASQNVKVNAGTIVIVALTPLIGSLFYTNFIAEWPKQNQNNSYSEIFKSKLNYSFKDYYESTQIFNLNILSINL